MGKKRKIQFSKTNQPFLCHIFRLREHKNLSFRIKQGYPMMYTSTGPSPPIPCASVFSIHEDHTFPAKSTVVPLICSFACQGFNYQQLTVIQIIK